MAQGRLVAAASVGGHRELIEDGVTGTLFPPGDPQAMAKALADMLSDRSLWDERRRIARAFVERDRNWSSNISRYEPVYQKLLGRFAKAKAARSEEHTSELQSLMRISYAVFRLKKKEKYINTFYN